MGLHGTPGYFGRLLPREADHCHLIEMIIPVELLWQRVGATILAEVISGIQAIVHIVGSYKEGDPFLGACSSPRADYAPRSLKKGASNFRNDPGTSLGLQNGKGNSLQTGK